MASVIESTEQRLQRVRELLKADPDVSLRSAAIKLEIPVSTVGKLIQAARKELGLPTPGRPDPAPQVGPPASAANTLPISALTLRPPFSTLFSIKASTMGAIALSMRRDGFHAWKPVEVWEVGDEIVVVEGNTRVQAATSAGLEAVPVHYREFTDERAALEYAVSCQRDRRNLTDPEIARCVLALDERDVRGGDRRSAIKASSDALIGGAKTAERTAELVGTSASKVERLRTVVDHGDEGLVADVMEGRKSINGAAREVRESRQAERSPGKSRLNGELVDDPPEIAKARAAGRIAPDVVPEITEGDAETNGVVDEPDMGDDSLSDEEWLATLPAREKVGESLRKWFDADALLYRELEPARKTFQHHARRALKLAKRQGAGGGGYAYMVARFLRTEHPQHWQACVATEHGGCGGKGTVESIGQCTKCHGRGYTVR